jgi:hypothetical protein
MVLLDQGGQIRPGGQWEVDVFRQGIFTAATAGYSSISHSYADESHDIFK